MYLALGELKRKEELKVTSSKIFVAFGQRMSDTIRNRRKILHCVAKILRGEGNLMISKRLADAEIFVLCKSPRNCPRRRHRV